MTLPVSPPSVLSAHGVDTERARAILGEALAGADDGELFLEQSESESFVFDDGRLKSAAYDSTEGFGLRVVAGETAGYAHAAEISEAAIQRAADAAKLAKRGYAGVAAEAPRATNAKLYGEDDPVAHPVFSDKVALLQEIDAYARGLDGRVAQVSASLAGERRVIEILRADGRLLRDVRPLVRLNVSVTVEKDGRRETGTSGEGGRAGFDAWITPDRWQGQVQEAMRQAMVNLDAVACPAGEMDVVIGPGWNGVLLHEAVGHGLEGDFNRKGSSAFSGRIGERVAAPGVTVFDDGSILNRRGSLTIDDNGSVLWNNDLGHGDAMHYGDLDPTRPGMELYTVKESTQKPYHHVFSDAANGALIWGVRTGADTGRGVAADIDPRYAGSEVWGAANTSMWNSACRRTPSLRVLLCA